MKIAYYMKIMHFHTICNKLYQNDIMEVTDTTNSSTFNVSTQ